MHWNPLKAEEKGFKSLKTEDGARPVEKRLVDYTPPGFSVENIDITFEIFEDFCLVRACSSWQRVGSDTDLELDGSEYFDLVSVSLDGAVLGEERAVNNQEGLLLKSVPDQFRLEIVTKLYPKENSRLEGLYFSGGMFCTQCEAEGFRHITYFLDRPDVLCTYNVRLEADKSAYPVLLSNGNPQKSGTLKEGRHFAEWSDPHPKPSYLFALVAGNLVARSDTFVTSEGRPVELNVYVRPEDHGKTAFALEALKRSMVWEEKRFGLCYDLDVYNIVAVSDFNMGAMENKGLNIFNTKYILATAETATDTDFENTEGVIGHEYFHNWTGNRITCRDWFQLSLKEGLTVFRDQEFSSDIGSRAIKRIDDVKLLRSHQFNEDSGPLAHPVRPEKYIEINNFYTATVYNKGAEVIRMIHLLLGEENFQQGMRLYVERFDGMAVTCEDFVRCMEDAAGRDLSQFRLWYSQAGTPKLTVEREYKNGELCLTIEQSCPETPGQSDKKPMHIPLAIGWLDGEGNAVSVRGSHVGEGGEVSGLLELKDRRECFRFSGVDKDFVPSLHLGFSCPVLLDDDLKMEERAHIAMYESDYFARWEAAQRVYASHILNTSTQNETFSLISDMFEAALARYEEDMSLTALLLSLPSEVDLGQRMNLVDPNTVHSAREETLRALVAAHTDRILETYYRLEPQNVYSLEPREKARRRLRNCLLQYLFYMPVGADLIRAQFISADNMTENLAALSLICDGDFDFREEEIINFHSKWQSDALVIDKWFAVQALSKRADVLQIVKNLAEHKDFSIKNPNRLRSLISSFSLLNQYGFHQGGEESYSFLADMIVKVDQVNPQTAARLVAPLAGYQRFSNDNSVAMKRALSSILDFKDLSNDVRELTIKSLD